MGAAALGVAMNVILYYLMHRFGMPFYLDCIGTIGVSFLCGPFPGILTAVLTNVFALLFDANAIYFAFLNVFIALLTTLFVRRYSFRNFQKLMIYVLGSSFLVGSVSSLIHWFLLKDLSETAILAMVDSLSEISGMPPFPTFLVLNIAINILDKGMCTALAILILHSFSSEVLTRFRQSNWKQRPLSDGEIRSLKDWGKNIRFSIRGRIVVTLLVVSLVLSVLSAWIATSLYFKNEKEEKTQNAERAAEFAASVVDGDRVEEYLSKGFEAEGYRETRELLYKIRSNAAGVEYLYLLKVQEDCCYYVFDLETEDVPAYEPGERAEIEEAFRAYLPSLLIGARIEPIESDDLSGWVLTAYYPVRDSEGHCVCYAGADVSMSYMADYMRTFIIRSALILLAFFILVLFYGMWLTDSYITYPVSSIARSIDRIAEGSDLQDQLDADVKQIRSLDIHTGDEVEKLYEALCELTLNRAEQMRSIRRLSESTAKMQDGLIITMADMVENRDSDTGAHIQKTAAYVKIIVEGLRKKGYYPEKVTDKFISDCVRSAPLHDVGKINIPDEVLNKPGKLTDEEYAIMKTHTTAGKIIMEKAISTVEGGSYLKEARNMAAYHHERWDGKGYPEGLHGEVIPLAARIMAVADVFDALTSPRVYKPAFPLEKALSIIEEGVGTQFDPKCVEVFMDNLDEVQVILKKYMQET